MIVCPKCGKVIAFNSYFGGYICDDCSWEDDTYNKERVEYFVAKSEETKKSRERYELLLLATT